MIVPKQLVVLLIKALIGFMMFLIVYRVWVVVADFPPVSIGTVNDSLQPCPRTPNCVSTTETRYGFRARPVAFTSDPDSLQLRLERWIGGLTNARIDSTAPGYIHAEFRVPLLGTTDDLELLIDREAGILHVRSLSRTGPFNLGLNRLRIRRVRRMVFRNGW